ncbi:MAG: hypothetical protein JRJ86_08260 [Deltaproteobacteria bacterium]|nr:hypothetical protein [Deltaproteobacteria bacterium]MBW2117045.1 hypothetical protein [Deltaproteobacteria bacterium]MBW2343119.1 hypothetical protein [Deltaproteobacteria bacterium]
MKKVREAKEIIISINNTILNVELSIRDVDLIETLFDALTEYVKQGCAINVKQSYMTSPSDSVKMISKIITKGEQMDEWRHETRQLISVLRKKQ